MPMFSARNGFRILIIAGAFALIGALLVIGRIALKVFNEEKGEPEDSHDGI